MTYRQVGSAVVLAGALLLTFAGSRYTLGAVQADRARQAWDEASARSAVALARSISVRRERGAISPGAPVARLVIPRISLDAIVLEGVDDAELNVGPGHVPGSAFPGERGNAIISADRDRHFKRFDLVGVGDTIKTESGFHANTWVVVAVRAIDKDAPALFHTRDATLTLTTRWPIRFFGTSPLRLIVTAKPLDGHNAQPARPPQIRAAS